MSLSSATADITMHYNGFNISIEIKNDYKTIKETIRNKLYLTEEDMESFSIIFVDSEGDRNILDEDNFEEAFNSQDWSMERNVEKVNNNFHLDDLHIKEEMTNNFVIILKNKLKESDEFWKNKIKKIKLKYNKEIEELKEKEKLNKNYMKKALEDMSKFVKKNLGDKLEEYNNIINDIMNTNIKNSKLNLNDANNGVQKTMEQISQIQENMKQNLEISKINFEDFIYKSKINNNNFNVIEEED